MIMSLALLVSKGIASRFTRSVLTLLVIPALLIGLPARSRAACTDQHLIENNTSVPINVGQSWTATCDGLLQAIAVKADMPNAGLMTLKIFQGESLDPANLLSTQTGLPDLVDGENTYAVPGDIAMVTGQQYTFLFTNESANGIRFRYDVADGYVDGQATAGAGWVVGSDVWFQAIVVDPPAPPVPDPEVVDLSGVDGGGCFIEATGD